jgi:hypothetical protein
MVHKHPYSEKIQQEFRQYLVDWIIDGIQPISVVTNLKFRQFIYQLNPTFVMPCSETVKGIIHTAYNFSFPKLQQIIKDQAKSVSLTLDFWTAKNRQGFLGITCSFLNNSFELKEFTLDIAYVRYPHTSLHILETLEQILNEWKIRELVFAVTTDNGSNVKKAILDMKNVNWLGCTAHTLQLVIGKGLKLAEVLIARAKRLIDFFLRPKQSERLEDIQQKFPDLPNNSEGENIVNNFTLYFFLMFKKIILKFCI